MNTTRKVKVVLSAETVEKPYICEFDVCKFPILLHAKLLKSLFLGFFDSVAINLYIWHHLKSYNIQFNSNIFSKLRYWQYEIS